MNIKPPTKIRFTCKENFTTERKYGRKINKWLVVGWSEDGYKIFRMDTGLPLIETKFMDIDQCTEFALWIAKQYESVWDIWEAWSDCELLRIAQYTIPNGTEVYKQIEKVSNQKVICQS